MKNITALLLTVSALTLTACTNEQVESDDVFSLIAEKTIVTKYETEDKAWHTLQDELREQAESREEYDALAKEKLGEHPDIEPAIKATHKIVEHNPDSDEGFAALEFLIEQTRGMDTCAKWQDKALVYLKKYHLKKPEMLDLQYKLTSAYQGDLKEYDGFMRALAENSSDPIVQANTWYSLTRAHYRFLNVPALSTELRAMKKAKTLAYVENARNVEGYSEIDIYDPRRIARKLDPKLLSKIIDPLAFAVQNLSVGSQIPNVKMKDIHGIDDQISNYRGKIVLLDFWGTWCGPCIASIPELVDMKKQYSGDFEILSFAVDEKLSDVTEFQKDTDMPWAHWFVGTGKDTFIRDWSISAFPTYMLIDKNGQIQLVTNEMTGAFKEKIEELL